MAVISFKCPNCDGELIFDPATQKYKCEYCISKFTQAELEKVAKEQGIEIQNTAGQKEAASAKESTLEQNTSAKNSKETLYPSSFFPMITGILPRRSRAAMRFPLSFRIRIETEPSITS